MPDDHSKLVPLLPIPNRTVKRLSADDSAGSRVKVGHCQALTASKSPSRKRRAFCFFSFHLTTEEVYERLKKLKGLRANCLRVVPRRF